MFLHRRVSQMGIIEEFELIKSYKNGRGFGEESQNELIQFLKKPGFERLKRQYPRTSRRIK